MGLDLNYFLGFLGRRDGQSSLSRMMTRRVKSRNPGPAGRRREPRPQNQPDHGLSKDPSSAPLLLLRIATQTHSAYGASTMTRLHRG